MENTFYKKAKLATAIALVSSTTLLTGCLDDGNKANSVTTSTTTAAIGSNGVATTAPKGSVQGIVQDTNGNPIAGATVHIGNRTTTTSFGGTYQLDNVAVSGITITGDGAYLGGAISVVIVPPAGYLGAVVTVNSSALIDDGRSDQGTTEETGTANTNRFVDGFTAEAGAAVLPAVGENGSTITGVLRDNVTNEAIANQTLNLELKAVNGGDHTPISGAISYTSASYPVTTNEKGEFTITGVPTDSSLKFVVGGYNVISVDANAYNVTGVLTNDEVEKIHVGNVLVTKIPNDDTKSPFVTAIEEVSANAARGKLHDDTTNVLTVHFSEQVQSALIDVTGSSANSVKVRDVSTEAYVDVTVAVATDNRSITLTSATDFTPGSLYDIYLLKVDFQDIANNLLDDDDTLGGDAISYDFDNVNNNSDYLKLQVEAYRELNQDAAVVTGLTQLTTDSTPERMASLLDNASSAFADVNMSTTSVQQLNSVDDDDLSGSEDTKERLAALVVALDEAGLVDGSQNIRYNDDGTPMTGNIGLTTTFDVNTAGVKFTPSNASSYNYWIERNGSAPSPSTNIILDATTPDAQTTVSGPGAGTIEPKTNSSLADFQSTDIAFTVPLAKPGDVVYIQSIDDFGNTGSVASLVLVDNVPATTGVQAAYDESDDLPSSSTIFGQQYGNGAELANPDAQSLVGAPLLNINAGMLADHSELSDGTPSLDDLFNANTVDSTTDLPFIALAEGTYDKTAYEAWTGTGSPADASKRNRTIAVSFTEDIAWVAPGTDETKPAAAVNGPTTDATAGLTDWTIMNDIKVTSDAQTVNVDLAAVVVNDIFTLANTDGQNARVIDFTNVITDVSSVAGHSANVSTAAANAKVVINDAMPPLVTQAVYKTTGTAPSSMTSMLEVTFNEPVMVDTRLAIPVVTLGTVDIFLDAETIADHNDQPASARNVLKIPFSTVDTIGNDLLPIDRNTIFLSADRYTEGSLTADSVTDKGRHGKLDFSNIQDDFGNTWAEDNANLTAPKFAAFDAIGQFSSSVTPTQLPTGALTVNIVYNFTHAIDVNASTLGTVVGLDSTAVGNLFTLTGNTIAAATTGVISADRTQITINLTTGSALASGHSFDFQADVNSLWDSVATVNVNAIVVP